METYDDDDGVIGIKKQFHISARKITFKSAFT
jgi:hypothetical protein